MSQPATGAPPKRLVSVPGVERRAWIRHFCEKEALSRPLELSNSINWGTTVVDVSRGGLGLILCYPFKPGTYLAVDLEHAGGVRTFLVCVNHVADRPDGTWQVGCAFARPLTEEDLRALV